MRESVVCREVHDRRECGTYINLLRVTKYRAAGCAQCQSE